MLVALAIVVRHPGLSETRNSMLTSIKVLLVYVANPPVSDAIEGAYLVAAFVPACILGGLALIFKDLLEGLGCMLGGFCLSMWFLVLKSGGLITSNGGRVGLIVALTLAGYSLSFTHYTRHYALIGCLAFSGSTVAILGVDCFSCVGLKEFWIYLWSKFPRKLSCAHQFLTHPRSERESVPPRHQHISAHARHHC